MSMAKHNECSASGQYSAHSSDWNKKVTSVVPKALETKLRVASTQKG